MSHPVITDDLVIKGPTRAIVCFGPATPLSGFKAGEYYQVVIDPAMASPDGEYIRFDQRRDDNEIHGWQRCAAITVCSVLQEISIDPNGETVVMRAIVKE